ncbi:Lrp/AsnC family transcriptional regulator [Mycobacterium sp. MAA66]|uniref:Lrp/AsnC family transcriptional regulator n=1 Tax=Mycobacterium sp. MAA66 TaxID=3156297 RepID=UPI003516E1F1
MADGIDEVDLALLDGVHVNPRAGFDELGKALGISGATAARRWRRLVETGCAWVSSAPGPALPVVGALLEAECAPGAAQTVADQWAAVPHAFSVHITTGQYNVYTLIVAADPHALAQLVIDVLPTVAGIRAVRASGMTRPFNGVSWRLGAMSAQQASEVRPPQLAPARHTFDDTDRELYLTLQHDGRLTYRELAVRLGCSEASARRKLNVLMQSELLTFRADFARAEAGWPTNVILELRLNPGTDAAEAGRTMAGWPETRVCVSVFGGAAQLFVTVQVHRLDALAGFIARLQQVGASVLSSRVLLRQVKSFGRLIDDDGRAGGVVPVDPWAPVDPDGFRHRSAEF